MKVRWWYQREGHQARFQLDVPDPPRAATSSPSQPPCAFLMAVSVQNRYLHVPNRPSSTTNLAHSSAAARFI